MIEKAKEEEFIKISKSWALANLSSKEMIKEILNRGEDIEALIVLALAEKKGRLLLSDLLVESE